MTVYEAKWQYELELLSKKNVVGVGVNEEDDVVVFVERKEPIRSLRMRDVIDRYVFDFEENTFRTDVVEVGKIKSLSLYEGMGITPAGLSGVGTLGTFVRHEGNVSLLTNWHVIGDQAGTAVYTAESRVDDDAIAKVTKGVLSDKVDCAVARLVNSSDIQDAQDVLDQTNDVDDVVINQEVSKFGYTSGLTSGVVTALDVTVDVEFGPQSVRRFTGQIATTPMLDPGDSGSVGYDGIGTAGPVWGLGFAGSDQVSFWNPLQRVLNELDARLLQPGDTEHDQDRDNDRDDRPGCLGALLGWFRR